MVKTTFLIMLLALCLTVSLFASSRAIWVSEDFASGTFPPAGWTISANAANWSLASSASAGGSTPEAHLTWSPQFNGTSYLISPQYDTTGETTVYLDYNQYVDYYDTPFTLGVATRSNNGAWNVAFSQIPAASVGPELKTVTINNADVGSSTFQFALYFSGSSYNINDWYIDNVKLYTPFPNDLSIMSIPGSEYTTAGVAVTPSCIIKNPGLSNLTATVSLAIYQGQNLLQSYPDYYSQMLNSGAQATVSFPSFTPTVENELYRFVYNISSLEDVIDGDLSNNTKEKAFNTWTTAKQNVLLEIGTGGWCQYCPGAAMAADDFEAGGYNVAIIENHNGDPYATDTSNGRNTYYGVSGYPTGIFDGQLSYGGGNHTTSVFPAYLPLFNQRVGIKTPISLALYGSATDLTYTVDAQINKIANLAFENLVLHFAITESHIQYAWQGQTEMNFVNRMMVPDLNGTSIDLKNAPIGVMNVPLTFNYNGAWDIFNSEFVAFVQNLDTKEVLQAFKVPVLDLPTGPVANEDNHTPVIVSELKGNYPNPFNPETTIAFSLKENAPVSIEIFNLKGQKVKTLLNENQTAGDHSIVWKGTDDNNNALSSGVYFYKMTAGKYSSTKKMIMMK